MNDNNYMAVHPIILDILDFLIDSSNETFILQIHSKEFLRSLLTLLKVAKEAKNIQIKILYLIKKWGTIFEKEKNKFPNFYEVYKDLKEKGCEFPNDEKIIDNYRNYIGDMKIEKKYSLISNNNNSELINSKISINEKEKSNNELIESTQRTKEKSISNRSKLKGNYGEILLDLNPKHYPKKFTVLVGELLNLLEYVNLDNIMIDNFILELKNNPNKNIDSGIIDLTQTIQDLSVNLRNTVQKSIDHEQLLGICIGILDDLERLSVRYNQLVNKQKVQTFTSVFHEEYSEYDLNNPNSKNKKKENLSVEESEDSGEDDGEGEEEEEEEK
jgi:hypothetical protein